MNSEDDKEQSPSKLYKTIRKCTYINKNKDQPEGVDLEKPEFEKEYTMIRTKRI